MPINFFKGHPLTRLLPLKQLAAAYAEVLAADYGDYEGSSDNRNPLTYGTDEGNLDVRQTLARWVGKHYLRTVDPDTINLTAGASYGFANVLAACTHPSITRHAFVVLPTYFLINGALLDAGFEGRVSAIKETPELEYDIDLVALEKALIKLQLKAPKEPTVVQDPTRGPWKYYRFVMYLVPTFSNPGGLTYSQKTRQKLLEMARAYDMLLVCDDVYDLLDYRANPEPVAKLAHLDIDSLPAPNGPFTVYGNTVSNNTFSKILAPGLRFGWQECPLAKLAWQIANTGANKSGGSPGQLQLVVVARLVELGELDSIIAGLVETYALRVKVTKDAIAKYLPAGTQSWGGDGGYFLWVRVEGVDNHQSVVTALEKHGVVLALGANFEVVGDPVGWGKNCVRLLILYLEPEDIEAGIKLWGEEIKRHQKEVLDDPLARTARSSVLGDLVIMLTTEFTDLDA